MKTFTLPISTKYVSHWGIWEAVREILQNAYDQRDADPDCDVIIAWSGDIVSIGTTSGRLERSSLVLGESAKSDGARGKFGEGYKLALLVLLREGKSITIFNNDEMWTPKLVESEEWGATVLQITVEVSTFKIEGVEYVIDNMPEATWEFCQGRLDQGYAGVSRILPDQPGMIYVGGLFVANLQGFKYGYSFTPSEVTLDRDRGMAKDFDIKYAASKLHAHQEDSNPYDLLKDDAPDVAFLDSHIPSTSRSLTQIYGSYVEEHGDAVPVCDQRDVESAVRAGIKWTLVPKKLLEVLRIVKKWIIPSTESPAQRLRRLMERYQWSLPEDARIELDSIIRTLEGVSDVPVP